MNYETELNFLFQKYNKKFNYLIKKIQKDNHLENYILDKTFFLNDFYNNVYLGQRLYHIYFNEFDILKCPVCGNPRKWKKNNSNIKDTFNKNKKESNYNKTCLNEKCKKIQNQQATIKVLQEKYAFPGLVSPGQLEFVKQKKIKTCQKKWSKNTFFETEEFQEKASKTWEKKYKVKHHTQSNQSKEKKAKTNLNKYGVKCLLELPSTRLLTEEQNIKRIEKINQTNLIKYDFEWLFGSEYFKKEVKRTNLNKYGVEHNSQRVEVLEKRNRKGYEWKSYLFPSGRLEQIQGWEWKALDELIKIYSEEDIIVKGLEIKKYTGLIHYYLHHKKHVYHPDIYIKSLNKIIEVKSKYFYKQDIEKNLLKKEACLKKNLKFNFYIY